MTEEFLAAWRPAERDAVAAHRADVARMLRDASGLAIAGGQVPTLLNRLHLLGVGDHVRGAPRLRLVGRRHGGDRADRRLPRRPPARAAYSRVLEVGLGWCQGVVALPHPRRRLQLDDARRVSLLARRFAPAVCLGFEDGAHYPIAGADGRPRHGVLHLGADGAVAELAACMSERRSGAASESPERPRADVDERAGPGGHRRQDRAGVPPPARARRPGRRRPVRRRPRVPPGRGPDEHVRLPRRGRRGAPPALGVRPPVDAGVHAPRRHRPLVPGARAPVGVARRVQDRGRSAAARRVDRGSAQPAAAPATPSAPTRSLHGDGLRAAGVDLRRPGGAHRARSSDHRRSSAALGRDADIDVYLPARFRPHAAVPAARRPRRRRLPRVRVDEDGARQPDPPPRDRRGRGRASPTRPNACASTPTTSATRASSPRSSCRALEAELPLATTPAGAVPDGRELRRGRVALRPRAAIRVASAACCCSPARSPSPTSARSQRGPLFAPVVEFVNGFRDRARGRQRAGVRQLRRVRVADLREPLARAAARSRPGWRSASSRRATVTTGRTGATACARALVAVPRPAAGCVYE